MFVIFAMSAVFAYPQVQEWKDPKIFAAGGGNQKDGYDFTANVRKNVWESDNGRHSFDVTGGYSQHLGGPYGNSPADRRVGGIYTYRCMALAMPQYQPDTKKLPQITTIGNGSFKQGNVNFDVRQQLWQSPNQRHSIHGTGGYSRNWGEPKPIDNQKNYRVGFNIPPPNTNYIPQITTSGGGTPDVGKVNIDVRQKIWESQNGRHLIDVNGGYSNKWGNPHIKATPDIRYGFNLPPPEPKNLPQLSGGGGGSRKQGFDVSLDARQKVWESQNKRHSVDASVGYSQHLGGQYGSSRPSYRGGVAYVLTLQTVVTQILKFNAYKEALPETVSIQDINLYSDSLQTSISDCYGNSNGPLVIEHKNAPSELKMKIVYLLAICVVYMAALAAAQKKDTKLKLNLPPPTPKTLPQLTGGGGGSRKQGFDVSLDASKKVWESQNKRHSVDASVGYGQHLGGPYGNSRPDYRGGTKYKMKFIYLLVICAVYMAAMVAAKDNDFKLKLPPPEPKNLPQLSGGGGGSRKQGFDVSLDASQKVWESQNKRHSVDASVGYSQHLGGPYGNSRPEYRGGVGYTYRFGKK
ncbi:Diptericin-D [Lucilia cuprina]|nr:Diptericin-D [Lucilia cuprina]